MNNFSKYSWLITALILLTGFLLLHFGFVRYGNTFFIAFPCAVGFSMGTLEKRKRRLSYLILGALVFFGFLLAGALEGLVCVLMALPIFILMIFLGYIAQEFVQWRLEKKKDRLVVSFLPLLLLIVLDPIEQRLLPPPATVEISNSLFLHYNAEIVFDEVKSMDKLDADKPVAMLLGLPAPYKCVLEADTVGARRHCLFENGEIVAEITAFEKGVLLEMDVVRYDLTGREWFHFIDAGYVFEKVGHTTRITRTSSYKSILHPRAYWEPLEKWGIEQEHTFVLNSLKKNLIEKYGDPEIIK